MTDQYERSEMAADAVEDQRTEDRLARWEAFGDERAVDEQHEAEVGDDIADRIETGQMCGYCMLPNGAHLSTARTSNGRDLERFERWHEGGRRRTPFSPDRLNP